MNKFRRLGALAAASFAVLTVSSLVAAPAASAVSASSGAAAAASSAVSGTASAGSAALLGSAASAASSVASVPAKAAPAVKGPEPINQLIAVQDGKTTWVKVWWKTDRTICNAKLIVWGNSQVEIGYPLNTRNYAPFNDGPTLVRRDTDFTSFRVTPHVGSSAWVILAGTLTYDYCGRHDRTQSKSTGFLLTVRA